MRWLILLALLLPQASLQAADLHLPRRVWTATTGHRAEGVGMLSSGSLTLNTAYGEVNVPLSALSPADRKFVTAIRNNARLSALLKIRGMQTVGISLKDGKPIVTNITLVVNGAGQNLELLGKLAHLESAQIGTQQSVVPALIHLKKLPQLKSLWILKQFPMQSNLTLEELEQIREMKGLTQFAGRVTNEGAKSLAALSELKHLKLDLSPLGSEGLSHLTGLKKLESLRLKHTRINDGSLKHVGKFTNLRRLEILYTRVNDDAMRHLAKLKKLEVLWLTSQVGGAGLRHIKQLPQLKRIVRNQNWQHDDVELDVLKDFPLDEIYIMGREFTKGGLAVLSEYKHVKKLTLHSGDLTDKILRHLAGLQQLESLMISIRLSGSGLEHLSELKKLKSLRLLSHRRFSDRHLSHLSKLQALEELELTCVPRGDEPYGDGLAVLSKLAKLRRFVVPGDYLSDEGWQQLAKAQQLRILTIGGRIRDEEFKQIAQLANLEELAIKTNQITDEGAAALNKLKQLKKLDLEGARITDQSASHLQTLSQLEELLLPGTSITDATLSKLETLDKLRHLDVTQTRVTAGGVRRLREKLPFCLIRFGRRQPIY